MNSVQMFKFEVKVGHCTSSDLFWSFKRSLVLTDYRGIGRHSRASFHTSEPDSAGLIYVQISYLGQTDRTRKLRKVPKPTASRLSIKWREC